MHKLICLGLALLALPVQAAWYLDYESSRLSFISTKNATLSEVGRFLVMHGKVDDKGQARLRVELDSVSTDIRCATNASASICSRPSASPRRRSPPSSTWRRSSSWPTACNWKCASR